MNKIDLFFTRNMWLTYIMCVILVPCFIGLVCGKVADTLNEALQYNLIAIFVWILFYTPKIKKYKEFNDQ